MRQVGRKMCERERQRGREKQHMEVVEDKRRWSIRKENERKMDKTQQKEVMRQTIPVNVLA